jgi:hypothetical protein
MWNIVQLKERQDCIEMFMVRHAHDFPVLKAVHTEIWGAQIVTKPHTLKSSVRQASRVVSATNECVRDPKTWRSLARSCWILLVG